MRSRREFLKALLATPIAATFDVERLLWVPGQMVTVPALPCTHIFPPLMDDFFRSTPLLRYLRDNLHRTYQGAPIELPLAYSPHLRLPQ